jgi:hypothetical protein
VKGNDDICSTTRNIFVDRLADARLKLGQIARQVDHNVALLSIHRIKFDAEFCPTLIDLAVAVASHAPHMSAFFSIRAEARTVALGSCSTMIKEAMHCAAAPQRNLCSLKIDMPSAMHAL